MGGRKRKRERETLISFPENFNYNMYAHNPKEIKSGIDMWGKYKYLPQKVKSMADYMQLTNSRSCHYFAKRYILYSMSNLSVTRHFSIENIKRQENEHYADYSLNSLFNIIKFFVAFTNKEREEITIAR